MTLIPILFVNPSSIFKCKRVFGRVIQFFWANPSITQKYVESYTYKFLHWLRKKRFIMPIVWSYNINMIYVVTLNHHTVNLFFTTLQKLFLQTFISVWLCIFWYGGRVDPKNWITLLFATLLSIKQTKEIRFFRQSFLRFITYQQSIIKCRFGK